MKLNSYGKNDNQLDMVTSNSKKQMIYKEKGSFNTSKSLGFGSDDDHQNSTTYSSINTNNIQIRDEQKQLELTGKSAENTIKEIKSDIDTNAFMKNTNYLSNNFDKQKVKDEIALQVDVTKQFDQTRQDVKQDIYNYVDNKRAQAVEIRRNNFINGLNGYNTAESLKLEADATKWEKGAFYLDAALGALYGWGNTDAIKYVGSAVAADPAVRAATAPAQIWLVKCNGDSLYCANASHDGKKDRPIYDQKGNLVNTEDANYKGHAEIGDKRQIIDINEIVPGANTGVITVSNNGILNPRDDALKNAVKQNNWGVNQDGVVVIYNPPTGNYLSELLYAGYDKGNDLLKGRLPLTSAEKANLELYQYAKNNGYQLDLSNHSRGGLTAGVAIKHANRNGLTEVPIRESRFYGTATNVKDYMKWVNNQNSYAYKVEDGTNYGTGTYSAVHHSDFVGRTPLIFLRTKYLLGGNKPTGGVDVVV